MEQLIELLTQIQDLAGVAIEALQGAAEGGQQAAGEAAGRGGAGGGEAVPTAPEGPPPGR